jgi:hypothetical protein
VSTATAAIASPASSGWVPVAKPTTVRTRLQKAAINETRRAMPDGPAEAEAATIAPASAEISVPLTCGSAAPRAPPTTMPPNR